MFLKKLEEYDHSTPGKNNNIRLSRIIAFIVIIVISIVFSSITDAESVSIRGAGGSAYSCSNFSNSESQITNYAK
jgi:hypothetical protein